MHGLCLSAREGFVPRDLRDSTQGGAARRHSGRKGRAFRRLLRTAAAACALAAIVLWFQRGVVARLADRVDNAGDPLLNAWIVSWNLHALRTAPLSLWHANIFYPHKYTLAYSENLIVPSLLVAPAAAFTDNPVLLYNLAFLLGCLLSAAAGYLLGRALTRSHLLGIALGAAVACGPFRLAHGGHMQIQHGQWMVLAFLFTVLYFRRFRGAAARRTRLGAACVAMQWQFLSNMYYFMFAAPVLALLQAFGLGRTAAARRRAAAVELAAFWAALAVIVLPFARPYMIARGEQGMTRAAEILEGYGAAPRDYAAYNAQNAWFGRFARGSRAENQLCPGALVALAALLPALRRLAAVRGAGRRRMRPGWAAAFLCAAAFGVWMSFGPRAGLYGFFHRWVPGYDGMRVPARFAGVVAPLLAAAAALNVAALSRRMRRPAARAALCALFAAGVIAEFWSRPRRMQYLPGRRPVYDWLAAAPDGPVVELPLPDGPAGAARDAVFTFQSTRYWKPLFNGYSGYAPRGYYEDARIMAGFPSAAALARMRELGIRYVLAHRCDREMRAACAGRAALAARFGTDCVFDLLASEGTESVR